MQHFEVEILPWEFISSQIRMAIGWKLYLQKNSEICRIMYGVIRKIKPQEKERNYVNNKLTSKLYEDISKQCADIRNEVKLETEKVKENVVLS